MTDLRIMKRWVCADKGSKAPLKPLEDAPALLNDPDTWTDYNTAKNAVESGLHDYVGFVFYDDGIVGVDIDDGFDEDGFLTVKAAEIIGWCHSYTELSRSGRGFHILLKGDLPFKGKNNRDGVEIYKTGRYFILTENTLIYTYVVSNQEAINKICTKYFPKKESEEKSERLYDPVWELNGRKVPTRPKYPAVPQGCRNVSMLSVAGGLKAAGYDPFQILQEVLHANRVACKPPLSDRECESIVESVLRYE